MKKNLILSGIVLLFVFFAKGAIVYVQPSPAINYTTNGSQPPGIDIDGNGVIDLQFRLDFQGAPGQPNPDYYYHLGGFSTGAQGIMDASLGLNPGGGAPYWKILSAGTSIGAASANFQTLINFPEPVLGDVDNDNIINKGDCFIGFKFSRSGNTHYAWMRVNMTGNTSNLVPIVVKDWAYESTPNTAINAGAMGGGSTTTLVTAISVSSQSGASTITTNSGTLQMTATITPANATNKSVTWTVQNGTGSATINPTGLLTAQANGTVTVRATAQDGSNVSGTKVITISGQTLGLADINTVASSVYPNPVNDLLTIEFEKEETIDNITITNLSGQEIYTDASVRKGQRIVIPTASLAEGLYILNFRNADKKYGVQRFLKQ